MKPYKFIAGLAIIIAGMSLAENFGRIRERHNSTPKYLNAQQDLNGDGLADIVVTDRYKRVQSIFLQQESGRYISLEEDARMQQISAEILQMENKKYIDSIRAKASGLEE